MKLLAPLAAAMLSSLLSSCVVPSTDYYGAPGYGGYVEYGYTSSDYYWDGHRHCLRPGARRHYGHHSSHGGNNNHGGGGHGSGSHVGGWNSGGGSHGNGSGGNHTGNPRPHGNPGGDQHSGSGGNGSHGGSSGHTRPSTPSPEPARHESTRQDSRRDTSESARGENKAEDIGRKGRD